MAANDAAEAGPVHGDREVTDMANKKAAPVVAHGERQAQEPKHIIHIGYDICNGIAAGFLGIAMGLLVCGSVVMFLLMLAVSVLLAVAAEVQR